MKGLGCETQEKVVKDGDHSTSMSGGACVRGVSGGDGLDDGDDGLTF